METYKLTYTGKEVQKKLDKIEIYNFTGKFTDDSTESEWCFYKYNLTDNTEEIIKLDVNPETKEFKGILDDDPNYDYCFYQDFSLGEDSYFEEINISDIKNLNLKFNFNTHLKFITFKNIDTSNVTDMNNMFSFCSSLTILDLSLFVTSNVTDMNNMFNFCLSLITLDLSNFDISKVTNMNNMFGNCNSLNYIKCKQAFKDWCIENQETIYLPESMREGGSGTWDIVDVA